MSYTKLKDVAENWVVCRICLHQPSTGLRSIFHQDDGKDLPLLIQECGGVPVKQFDHYPDKICTKCLQCLNEAYIFRKTCQHSHKRLSELIAPMDVGIGEQQRLGFAEEYTIEQLELKFDPKEVNSEINTGMALDTSNVFDIETEKYVPEIDDGKNLELSVKLKEEIVENEMISEMCDAFDEAAEEFIKENAIEKGSEIYYKKAEVNVQKNQKMYGKDVTKNAECPEELENEPCISSTKQKCLRGSNTYISADRSEEEFLPNIKETFDCNVCRITFALDQDLIEHVKKHKNECNNRKSSTKQKWFRGSNTYISADRSEEEFLPNVKETFDCNVCRITFALDQDLMEHVKKHKNECKTHTNELPYACDICNKSFNQKGVLITHKFRVHKVSDTDCNLKTFKCEICENTFSRQAHLVRHMRIHTGERPFACLYCPKAFTDSSARKSHHRTHTNERPYAYDLCGLSFALKPTLRKHRIRAHNIN